jgi:hypothetical protein
MGSDPVTFLVVGLWAAIAVQAPSLLWRQQRLISLLRRQHADVWSRLGRPALFDWDARSTWRWIHFVLWREWQGLVDPTVAEQAVATRTALLVYFSTVGGGLMAVVVAVALA